MYEASQKLIKRTKSVGITVKGRSWKALEGTYSSAALASHARLYYRTRASVSYDTVSVDEVRCEPLEVADLNRNPPTPIYSTSVHRPFLALSRPAQ